MTIAQAKPILAKMINWHLFNDGFIDDQPEPITESLASLIAANKIMERHNQKEIATSNGGKYTLYTTLNDRQIAALYTAVHFDADHLPIACYHNKGIYCIQH